MHPSAPSTDFPGNIFFYAFLIGFGAFFLWSVSVRLRWFASAQWVNRFGQIIERVVGLFPYLLGNSRVVRPRYWYSGLLHTLIWWGFIVLQVRTLNFLLNGSDHDISLEKNLGDAWDYVMRPTMDTFNVLVIVGVAMAAFQRFVWRPQRLTLNYDAWIILFLIFWLMVTDVMVNSFEIYLFDQDHESFSFLAYGVSQIWDGLGMSQGTAEAFHTVFFYQHLLDFLIFLCYLPYSKHSHVLTVAPQIFTRRLEPTGVLAPIVDMDMRRFMVMEQSNMPETAAQTLMQLEQRGHPWRGTQLTRTTWIEEMAAEGVEVPMFDGSQEYLYWVGCTGALQERNVKVTKALVRLFLEAGVSFGVLGGEEGCSGDPARRLGNEYRYQMQAEQHIGTFKAKGVQKGLANCPHCYNTIAHEYPQFDGKFETVHHSVFLAQLVAAGKLRTDSTNA